jgi:hypothetical protein
VSEHRISLTDWTPPLRIKGHTLRYEGDPLHKPGCAECSALNPGDRTRGYGGHGRCSCGEYGPCDDTNASRKRWHRQHKLDVAPAPAVSGQPEADR